MFVGDWRKYRNLLHDTIQVQRRRRANIGTLRGRIVPVYRISRFGTIDHIWHNCQTANLTSVHLQPCSQRKQWPICTIGSRDTAGGQGPQKVSRRS